MSKAIFKTLREQSAIGFDGKIVFQDSLSGQQVGIILISSGYIVGSSFKQKTGKKSLINLLVEDFSGDSKLSHTVEPEVIGPDKFQYEISLDDLEIEFRELYEKIEKFKKLKPPENKRIIISADFVCRGSKIDSDEFDVLCLVSDYGKVSDIYSQTDLYEFEVTNALVSLRRKGALRVLS